MKKTNNFFLMLILISLVYSCKKPKIDSSKDSSKSDSTQTEMFYRVIFPDTVKLNKKYDGYMEYKGDFDKVTTEMFGDEYMRSIILEIDSIPGFSAHKEFYDNSLSRYQIHAINNQKIPLWDFSFHSLGVFELKFKLEDSYFLNYPNPDSLEKISSSIRIKTKVVVVE